MREADHETDGNQSEQDVLQRDVHVNREDGPGLSRLTNM
jgi:hypothetical protein